MDLFSRITVLICHGFVGSRIGVDRLFVKAARDMAAHGFNVVRFDYAGCGESEGEYGAGGMDALLRQTRDVLEHVRNMESGAPGRLILLGHSLGGAVSLLTAARDSRVDGLVLWAPVLRPFEDIVRGDHTFSAHDAYQRLISRTTAWLAQQAGNETVAV